ncbi:TRAP transporter large permease [Oceanibacterium hippocampi]|uniref:TRAP transporter large permease protein n=1 Tax=Oceanibacterium hippocampi TaxID=745714 RepID=A0A1Y5TSD7_9PROT|nr:TRAP transporter large permease [Oceanibacterium hippocampi]SLN67119.1 Sialic acid TRAP transporter permease protein SiaT [Oceanibacterium hippocampi]
MDNLTLGFAGVGVVLALLAMRVPIAVALGGVSIVGIAMIRGIGPALGALGTLPFDFAANWSLSAIPMFLFMGSIAFHTGLTSSLYNAARIWLNRLPGGLAVATNLGAAGFAAASGSSLATAAAMGRLAIPEMLKFGYDKALATGTVAAAGTLGALIPPSVVFIIYGWFTQQPIGKLLIAGIIPGLLTALVYTVMIVGRCIVKPSLAPQIKIDVSWADRWRTLRQVWPLPLLIMGIVGGIYGGLTTPTEAGAFGAFLALVISLAQGRLTWSSFRKSVEEAIRTTAAVFFIAIGAILLSRFLALAGVPAHMAVLVNELGLSEIGLIVAMCAVYLVLGMFLDPLGLMLLTLPVFLPVFEVMNLDLIWIGVLVVKLIEIGLLTPPVGLNAYVVKGVVGDSVPLSTIFRGLLWFIGCEIFIMLLLVGFPELSTWLPGLMR